ncbi:MAG TPA: major tail protein [Caproicibacter sp.]|nr:major tail protein [Caproicibacter sp.]
MLGQTIMPEITGCDNLYVAKIIRDTADSYVTDVPRYFAPVSELKHDPKAESAVSYYDNSGMFVYPYEGEAADEATISGLSEQDYAEVTGKSYSNTSGIVFDSGDPMYSPYYALGYRIQCGSVTKYRWLLKGLFVLGSEDIKTKGDKVDPKGVTLTFKPVRTIHQWNVPDPRDATKTINTGLKIVKADTSNPAFAGEDNWFSQVQTPDTIGAPAALTFTVVPANNATGVLATAKPVITFSNPITDFSGVTLVENNSIVTASVTVDSTGKILTITPETSLTSAGVYTIVLAGVTDIYGHVLSTQSIKFTVA